VAQFSPVLSQVKEQLSQLRAADSQAALHTDAAQDSADDSPEEMEQLSQLRAADSQAALHTDAAQDSADDSPEEMEMTLVLSRSQRHRRRAADRHAAAAAVPPLHLHLQQQHASETHHSSQPPEQQSLTQHASTTQVPQPQRQQQQQPQMQLSRGPERLGIRVLNLPVSAQPFPVSFVSEADAEQRRVARQQAQRVAQLENTEMDSDESDTPPSSLDDFVVGAKYGFVRGRWFDVADAWLEDEAVFDSSDDVSGVAGSDSDWDD
jgi:hypothetical protein